MIFAAYRPASAGVDVSVDFFYDNLGADGDWVELDDYGYCWQPAVAVQNSHWRPYTDGHWVYTDAGWFWVSSEDFGWATYHYGRWLRLQDRGWFWVPGRVWGPAWVSWRTGGDYIGWAPLPPRVRDDMESPVTGRVDVEFDIGPAYYNFIDVRYIGEPVLRERIFEPTTNVTYITQTVNVTNITYVNSTVRNFGPDYEQVSRYSTQPVRRMTLERETTADFRGGVKPNQLTKVEGDKLVVAAPSVIQKPTSPIAPKAVKEKIAKPKVENGWGNVPDPKTQEELKQKMKSEDPKNVPPPNAKAVGSPQPAANPPAGGAPSIAISPKQVQPASQLSPNTPRQSPASEQVTPTKPNPSPDVRGKQPLREATMPPQRITTPSQVPSDIQPNRPPVEKTAPPKRQQPEDAAKQQMHEETTKRHDRQPESSSIPPKQPAPQEHEVPRSNNPPPKQTPPARMTQPNQQTRPDQAPQHVPPKREAPPQQAVPPQHAAPQDNVPKQEPPQPQHPKDKKDPAPTPAPKS